MAAEYIYEHARFTTAVMDGNGPCIFSSIGKKMQRLLTLAVQQTIFLEPSIQ